MRRTVAIGSWPSSRTRFPSAVSFPTCRTPQASLAQFPCQQLLGWSATRLTPGRSSAPVGRGILCSDETRAAGRPAAAIAPYLALMEPLTSQGPLHRTCEVSRRLGIHSARGGAAQGRFSFLRLSRHPDVFHLTHESNRQVERILPTAEAGGKATNKILLHLAVDRKARRGYRGSQSWEWTAL